MKNFIAILFIGLASFAFGQNFEAPKKGAKIYAQEYSISLEEGGETTFDLWIVRSRLAKKTSFSAPELRSSTGLTFEVSQDSENVDHYVVTVSANDAAIGQYTTMVSAQGSSTQKVTGTTLSFNITAAKAVASKDGE